MIGAASDSTGDRKYSVKKPRKKDTIRNESLKTCPAWASMADAKPIAGNTRAVIIAQRHGELLWAPPAKILIAETQTKHINV